MSRALIITRREIRDTLRDWRIVAPILILTLIFPWLMNYTAALAMNFVKQYDAPIVGIRLVPFLMLVVGFFPISFSLVIALETFVGEKERNSLEPLLSMPISDGELYLGKMLAAFLPPLVASSLGIGLYLLGLHLTMDYRPEPLLLLQIWLLTAVEALVMVSGAVIVSSQTTSVRAANLLASFIILPMALLVQFEAISFFWGGETVLWVLIAGLVVVDIILIRTGVHIFNREELLGREVDYINLRGIWRVFKSFFLQGPLRATWREQPFSLWRVYGVDIPYLLREARWAVAAVLVVLCAGLLVGWSYTSAYRLPPGTVDLSQLGLDAFTYSTNFSFMPSLHTGSIFSHNVRSLLLGFVLSPFSFGISGAVLLSLPMMIVGWFVGQASSFGVSPLLFSVAFFLPHALFELPAAILSAAFGLRIGAAIMSPPAGLDVGKGLVMAVADYLKVFIFVVVPLLLVAAFLEANITPRLAVWLLAG